EQLPCRLFDVETAGFQRRAHPVGKEARPILTATALSGSAYPAASGEKSQASRLPPFRLQQTVVQHFAGSLGNVKGQSGCFRGSGRPVSFGVVHRDADADDAGIDIGVDILQWVGL